MAGASIEFAFLAVVRTCFNKIDGQYSDLIIEQINLFIIPVHNEPNEEIDRKYCVKMQTPLSITNRNITSSYAYSRLIQGGYHMKIWLFTWNQEK